jgi:hypothetical protein
MWQSLNAFRIAQGKLTFAQKNLLNRGMIRIRTTILSVTALVYGDRPSGCFLWERQHSGCMEMEVLHQHFSRYVWLQIYKHMAATATTTTTTIFITTSITTTNNNNEGHAVP